MANIYKAMAPFWVEVLIFSPEDTAKFLNSRQDKNGEKIFLIEEYNKRISFGGYRLLEDEKGKNYYNYLKDKIKGMYKPKVNVHFIKNIKIADKNYSLFATVEYEIGSSREPDTLHNGILTRMWIKENV